LKRLVSEDVQQAGSKVSASGLRFDFVDPSNRSEQVADLAAKVAEFVQNVARQEIAVSTEETTLQRAQNELKATALFGEKYGQTVRVVKCGDVSLELCGGTHVGNTRDLLPFEGLKKKQFHFGRICFVFRVLTFSSGWNPQYWRWGEAD
jgi:alanyl-tRNA synthetase